MGLSNVVGACDLAIVSGMLDIAHWLGILFDPYTNVRYMMMACHCGRRVMCIGGQCHHVLFAFEVEWGSKSLSDCLPLRLPSPGLK